MDASNAFNRANLGMPNANVTDQAAGRITGPVSQYQIRRVQLGGRFDF
jgi:hypothetical protein